MSYKTGFYEGRLGIGLGSTMGMGDGNPRYPLDINGDIRLTGSIVNGDGQVLSLVPAESLWTIGNNNLSYAGGNVGIGTSNPATLLTIGNHAFTDGTRDLLRFPSYRHNEAFTIRNNDDPTNGRLEFFWGNSQNGSGGHDNIVDKSILTLRHDGNVGIGTTSPTQGKLVVNGSSICGIYSMGDYTDYNYILNGPRPGNTLGGAVHFINHASRTTDGGQSCYTIRNDNGPIRLGRDVQITTIEGSKICLNSNVGIGTTNPGYKLEIVGSNTTGTIYGTATMHPGGSYFYSNHNNNTSVSAKFSSGLWCAGGNIMVSSDERIKENIVDVSDNLALEMVRKIPCRYYEYKDKYSRGTEKTIGFIAQEVKTILPMAVGVEPNIIPNEMRHLRNITWNDTTLYTDLSNCSGIKYRFYVSNDVSGNDEIMKEVVGNSDHTFTFDTSYNNVFCYGKEINDFHTLDKQKLFSLNFSATQELDRKVIALENENAELKAELAAIKQHLGI